LDSWGKQEIISNFGLKYPENKPLVIYAQDDRTTLKQILQEMPEYHNRNTDIIFVTDTKKILKSI
jgi:muconolactone delta-isomerase